MPAAQLSCIRQEVEKRLFICIVSLQVTRIICGIVVDHRSKKEVERRAGPQYLRNAYSVLKLERSWKTQYFGDTLTAEFVSPNRHCAMAVHDGPVVGNVVK